MSGESKSATFIVYTTFNAKTDKTNMVLVNTSGKSMQYPLKNRGGKYLASILGQIENTIIDGLPALKERGYEAVEIVFRRFKDKNLGCCLERIIKTVDKLVMVENEHEALLDGALRYANRSRMASYDVLHRIISKVHGLRQNGLNVVIRHEVVQKGDYMTELAWEAIKN